MTSAVEFINRWQRIALLSHSLLELAQRGEWDLLLEQEVTYLQSIEVVMEEQTPPGITRSIQDLVAGWSLLFHDHFNTLQIGNFLFQ